MASQKRDSQEHLEHLIRAARTAPYLPTTTASNKAGPLTNARERKFEKDGAIYRVLELDMELGPTVQVLSPSDEQNKTDGEVTDELLEGGGCWYNIFFLTSFQEDAGSKGNTFYIEVEGTLGRTPLEDGDFVCWTRRGEWMHRAFWWPYVGEITKITLGA